MFCLRAVCGGSTGGVVDERDEVRLEGCGCGKAEVPAPGAALGDCLVKEFVVPAGESDDLGVDTSCSSL